MSNIFRNYLETITSSTPVGHVAAATFQRLQRRKLSLIDHHCFFQVKSRDRQVANHVIFLRIRHPLPTIDGPLATKMHWDATKEFSLINLTRHFLANYFNLKYRGQSIFPIFNGNVRAVAVVPSFLSWVPEIFVPEFQSTSCVVDSGNNGNNEMSGSNPAKIFCYVPFKYIKENFPFPPSARWRVGGHVVSSFRATPGTRTDVVMLPA